MVTSLLALLALLVSLPICAMAEDYDGSEPISGNVDTYTGKHSNVTEEGSVTTNQGQIDTNMGTVENNTSVRDETSKTGFNVNTGRIKLNNGTVSKNGAAGSYYSGLVWENQALKSEDGTSYQEGTGVVENNYGCIFISGDENATTADSATVVDNHGYIYCNYGTVKDNEETGLIDFNGYQSVIENNNAGLITKNFGIVNSNSGTITKNNCNYSVAM